MHWVFAKASERAAEFGIQASPGSGGPGALGAGPAQSWETGHGRDPGGELVVHAGVTSRVGRGLKRGPRRLMPTKRITCCAGRDAAADAGRGKKHHPGHCLHQCHRGRRLRAGDAQAHHPVLHGARQLPHVRGVKPLALVPLPLSGFQAGGLQPAPPPRLPAAPVAVGSLSDRRQQCLNNDRRNTQKISRPHAAMLISSP